MLCLSDNDVILKLATLDLLGDALTALGVELSAVRVLSTAKYVLPRRAKKQSDVVASRVEKFLSSVGEIDWLLPRDELLVFEDRLGIDAGEAILFAATSNLTDFRLVTGDKVSLNALACASGCEGIVQRLAGRVVCFEQLVQFCIVHHGFDPIKDKIVPARECDKALASIFGSGLAATAANVDQALNGYIGHLRSTTGLLLL